MHGHDLALSLSLRAALAGTSSKAAIAPYTPLWHVRRVLKTSAADWWEGGTAPARGRASQALSRAMHAATGVAQRLHAPRHTG